MSHCHFFHHKSDVDCSGFECRLLWNVNRLWVLPHVVYYVSQGSTRCGHDSTRHQSPALSICASLEAEAADFLFVVVCYLKGFCMLYILSIYMAHIPRDWFIRIE